MNKKKIKKILEKYFVNSTLRAYLNGTRRPSYDNILMLNSKHDIPFSAWKDIKSFISSESITPPEQQTQECKKGNEL